MNGPRLLITRPADEAGRTISAVAEAGFLPVEAPLFVVEPLPFELPAARPDAILFTSPRAPERLSPLAPELRGCPVFSVGPRTTQAALRAGFSVAGEGEGDGNSALRLAAGQGHREILHPRGEDHISLDVPQGVALVPLALYRARAVETLPADVVRQLAAGDIFATLLMSPRTACLFTTLAQRAGLDRQTLRLVALSSNVAEAAGFGWGEVEVADAPRLEQALAVARRLWQGREHA